MGAVETEYYICTEFRRLVSLKHELESIQIAVCARIIRGQLFASLPAKMDFHPSSNLNTTTTLKLSRA